ncbi:MAG: DUF4157 domain-containing protein [Myxococcales bacterium]|nr:DUF4157 domain-containing protein [Myxococcales bacterium]
MQEGPLRELAPRGSERRGDDLDEDGAEFTPARRLAADPSKRTRTGSIGSTGSEDGGRAAPGKLVASGSDRAISPAQGLQYSSWLLGVDRGWAPAGQVHRRAETQVTDPDQGALASAFDFIASVGAGQRLPDELSRRLGAALGIGTQHIRIHTDDRAAAAAAELGARAFTIGSDIYFAAGAYDPTSESGIELIAHEVAHVAQNQRGTAGQGRPVSRPEDAHERQADEFASRFAASRPRQFQTSDPAELVDHVRRQARRMAGPGASSAPELEQAFDSAVDQLHTYTGQAAELAAALAAAGAFALRQVVELAEPSQQRADLLRELGRIENLPAGQAGQPGQPTKSGQRQWARSAWRFGPRRPRALLAARRRGVGGRVAQRLGAHLGARLGGGPGRGRSHRASRWHDPDDAGHEPGQGVRARLQVQEPGRPGQDQDHHQQG